MKSILTAVTHKVFFLSALTWGWVEVIGVPAPMPLVLLAGAMIVDLVTGLMKSWKNGEATTSEGFRRSVLKFGTYIGVLLGVWFLANTLDSIYHSGFDYTIIMNGTIGFLTFIEIYSIFENIYQIDPESVLSRKYISKILKFLKGRLDKHPIDDIADDLNQKNKDHEQQH